jgi:hypothetical protein
MTADPPVGKPAALRLGITNDNQEVAMSSDEEQELTSSALEEEPSVLSAAPADAAVAEPLELSVLEILDATVEPAAPQDVSEFKNLASDNARVGVQVGTVHGDVNVFGRSDPALDGAREFFMQSLRHRDEFVGSFLKQALSQAETTFRLSVFFMTVGGIFVLGAATLAITKFAGTPSHGIALASGLCGILITTSGAAFSIRADKARKHLASQASSMHTQLLDERRFTQMSELLAGIRDPQLNDQARVSLALRLLGSANDDAVDQPSGSLAGDAKTKKGSRKRRL